QKQFPFFVNRPFPALMVDASAPFPVGKMRDDGLSCPYDHLFMTSRTKEAFMPFTSNLRFRKRRKGHDRSVFSFCLQHQMHLLLPIIFDIQHHFSCLRTKKQTPFFSGVYSYAGKYALICANVSSAKICLPYSSKT